MKLLHLDSSILGTESATRDLGAAVVANWLRRNPHGEIRHLDLAREPLDHLSADVLAARAEVPVASDTAGDIRRGEQALEDFLAADVVVVGAPMYNFSIPTQLKAWIDRIAVAGKTFRYTANGPQGLAGGKKVVIVSARGGIYSAGPAAGFDHQESYLRSVFTFLGITDIEFVRAEALNMGAVERAESLRSAHAAIEGPLPLAA